MKLVTIGLTGELEGGIPDFSGSVGANCFTKRLCLVLVACFGEDARLREGIFTLLSLEA